SLKQQNNNERLIVKLNELEKLAEFPGGMEKFYKKVSENLDASELNYTGFTQIHVSFIIEKDGSMSEIVVDSTLDSELKKEIIIGLKSIKTKWLPATLENKPIRIEYSLPIVLNIE
ncbi:MAG: energy transducer TonB, partial [Flavobacterium sp.]